MKSSFSCEGVGSLNRVCFRIQNLERLAQILQAFLIAGGHKRTRRFTLQSCASFLSYVTIGSSDIFSYEPLYAYTCG